jgi:hypothetical protein
MLGEAITNSLLKVGSRLLWIGDKVPDEEDE